VVGHWGVGEDGGSGVGGVADVAGLHGFTGGHGDEVLDVTASNLGDDVAVLNLDGDNDDLRVVNATLGGDLTAGVSHGGGDGVSDGVGNGKSVGDGSGVSDEGSSSVVDSGVSVSVVSVESISLGLRISLTLVDGMVSSGGEGSDGCIAENIGELLAELDILNLLSVDGHGVADVLGRGDTVLGDHDLVVGDAVRGRGVIGYGGRGSDDMSVSSHEGGSQSMTSKSVIELGVSLCVCVSRRGSICRGNQAGHDEKLHDDIEIVDDFPRCKVELK